MKMWPLLIKGATLVIGWAYPAFMSVEAIETKSTADDTQWLTYWLLFALYSIVEVITWPALKWVPLYFELKLTILIWLTMPPFLGACWLYQQGRPMLVRVVKFVRAQVDSITGKEYNMENKDDELGAMREKISAVQDHVQGTLSSGLEEVSDGKSTVKKLDTKLDKMESVLESAPGLVHNKPEPTYTDGGVFTDIGSALSPS